MSDKNVKQNVAWWCRNCGRTEMPADHRHCPDCGAKMQRCSRYEWFLIDELSRLLSTLGVEYKLIPQYPMVDHRGFTWYFDIYVWVKGKSFHGGYGELIEVNGSDHLRQKSYKGAGGGYTRDFDKRWEAFANQKMHKRGFGYRVVTNDECTLKDDTVYHTAIAIVDDLLYRADTWC